MTTGFESEALRLAVFAAGYFQPLAAAAAVALSFNWAAWDDMHLSRASIELASISRIGTRLVFLGVYEPVGGRGDSRWFDVVSFDCRTREFKVLLALNRSATLTSLAEFDTSLSEAQNDAVAYGYLHNWASIKGLVTTLHLRCNSAPRSKFPSLPYQFAEGDKVLWWLDLATVEERGSRRSVFLYQRPFEILKLVRNGEPYSRINIKPEGHVTRHWSIDCKAKTIETLLTLMYDEKGNVLHSNHTPAPPSRVVPHSIGAKAFDLLCPR